MPGEAIDAGSERCVLHGHQFNGRLGEFCGGGVGPVNIPLKKAGDGQRRGLHAGPREAGNGSREAGRGLGKGGVRSGHSLDAFQRTGGITPGVGREGSDECGAITSSVQGVIPLFDEEGQFARLLLSGA